MAPRTFYRFAFGLALLVGAIAFAWAYWRP